MTNDDKILKAMQPRIDEIAAGMDAGITPEKLRGTVSLSYVHRLLAGIVISMQDGPIKRIEAIERKLGIVKNAKPVKRSITNILKHDSAGRIQSFEKLEGEAEELDIAAKLVAVEQKLAGMGDGLSYQGVWKKDRKYTPGHFVTHNGGMWASKVESTGVRPGDGLCWQLAVKGHDAR